MSESQDELVTIEVDGRELQVPKGETLIRATDRAGIHIPRFCYHKKMSAPANCRMCLVDIEKAPKPLPACATPVADGMKVYTRSKRAVSAQQGVMEFLLINHPLDCPVCDQGGECELQDLSMGYGRSVSRFIERKRVVPDPDIGPLISTDMTRCIHCTRCVRFLEELAGTRELAAVGRGEHMKITTWVERSVDSEMSGNVIDVCPVGALNNKPFRFKARAWEMAARDAVSGHDAVGSNLYLHVLRGKALRAVPRELEAVNECWLADRDRFSVDGLYAPERLTEPLVKVDGEWREVDWGDALRAVVEGIQEQIGEKGVSQFAALASPRSSVEELYLIQKLVRQLGGHNVDCRLRQLDFADQDAFGRQPRMGLAIADLEAQDAVLLVGSNIRHDQPILGHRLRKGWSDHQTKVALVNPVDWPLHFDVETNVLVKPGAMVDALAGIAAAAAEQGHVKPPKALARLLDGINPNNEAKHIARILSDGEAAAVLVGNFAMCHPEAALLRSLSAFVAEATGASLSLLPEAANSSGAWAAGCVPHRLPGGGKDAQAGFSARTMLEEPLAAYLLWDFDPAQDTALGAAALTTLTAARHVVAAASFDSPALRECANVLLPIGALPEINASLVSMENRWQITTPAIDPPGRARAGWRVLRVMGHQLGLQGFDFYELDAVRRELKDLLGDLDGDTLYRVPEELPAQKKAAGEFERIGDVPIYAGDALLRHTPSLQATTLAGDGWLGLNPADAEALKMSDGARVRASQNGYAGEFRVRVSDAVPAGAVWLPAARESSKGLGISVGPVAIQEAGGRRG